MKEACLLLLALIAGACAPARTPVQDDPPPGPVGSSPAPAAAAAAQRVDFDSQIRPVLEARCQPCHFPGGTMYERLPFDRAETIHHLGEKLFGQIEDEGEQALLRSFLAQEPDAAGAPGV
jgi:hypothetical protein